MVIYVMMALGLNIVVGYAGLLDLGYVAFYAIGAYTAAWLASPQFAAYGMRTVTSRRDRRPARASAASTSRSGWSLIVAAIVTAFARRPDRPADAAPARRLPRDRHARLRRDRAPRSPATATTWSGRLQPHERPAGDQPDRPARLRRLAARSPRPAGQLPVERGTYVDRPLLLGARSALVLFTIFCSASACATRGSAAPGSRSARTRPRPRRWAIPLMRTKTLGLRDRRLLRRRRRRLLRDRSSRARSRTTSSSTSRSSSSAWSSWAAWATSGA